MEWYSYLAVIVFLLSVGYLTSRLLKNNYESAFKDGYKKGRKDSQSISKTNNEVK